MLLLQRDGLVTERETFLAFPAAVKLRHGAVVVRYVVIDTEGAAYHQKLRRKYLVNAANPNPQLGNQVGIPSAPIRSSQWSSCLDFGDHRTKSHARIEPLR